MVSEQNCQVTSCDGRPDFASHLQMSAERQFWYPFQYTFKSISPRFRTVLKDRRLSRTRKLRKVLVWYCFCHKPFTSLIQIGMKTKTESEEHRKDILVSGRGTLLYQTTNFEFVVEKLSQKKKSGYNLPPPPSKEAGRQRRETSSYDLLPSEAPSPLDLLLWTAKVKTVKDVERSSKRFFKKLMTATNVPRIVYVSWKDFAGSCKVWVQI